MNRGFAVLAAAMLIIGAVLVRGVIDGDDDNGNGAGGRPTLRVVCADELRAACEGLDLGTRFDIEVMDAADTAATLADATPADAPDLWAVPTAWPAVAEDGRVRAGRQWLFGDSGPVLASTRLAVVGPAALDGCDWKCIGDRAPGGLRLGSRSLASTGTGGLTLGAVAAGYFGGPRFATNDFDPAFERWLSGFAGAVTESSGPVLQLLQSRAFFDAALSYEAEAVAALGGASADRKEGLVLFYPAPVVTLDIVVVPGPRASSSDADDLRSSLTAALTERGWSAPSSSVSGLPLPGVLTALRDRVQ